MITNISLPHFSFLKKGKMLFLACLFPFAGWAQDMAASAVPDSNALNNCTLDRGTLALSLNAGATFSYADVKPQQTSFVFGISAEYTATKYLYVNADVQKGWLKGGAPYKDNAVKPGFETNYYYLAVTARFLPLALLHNPQNSEALAYLSDIYVGLGIGGMSYKTDANKVAAGNYGPLSMNEQFDFLFPVEAGFSVPVVRMKNNRQLFLNLNYRSNLCFTDKIDGYVPKTNANKKNDAFNTLMVGIGINF